MYSKEQITFLMQNGFTVDEIMRMSAPQEQEAPVETPTPAPQEQEEIVSGLPFKSSTPLDRVEQLAVSVDNLVRMMQTNNINSMQFGSPVADRTVEDVLAEIINPKSKK